MSPANTLALLINGLTISLALFMLILLLWQDSRNADNLFFGMLIVMLVLWSIGSLLARAAAYMGGLETMVQLGTRLLEFGFTGSSIALYLFTIVLSGARGRAFLYTTSLAMVLLLLYQGWLVFTTATPTFEIRDDGSLRYAFNAMGLLLYASLIFAVVAVAWQRRRKIFSRGLLIGIFGFSLGIVAELVSPELRSKSVGLDISAISALLISFSMVRMQIIEPLRGRAKQLRAVRDVGLAMTSLIRVEEVLSTIATQAARILQADGAAIFLNQGTMLELAAVHNMPEQFRGHRLVIGEGLSGQVALMHNSVNLADYRHDWQGIADMPFAKDSFGAVIAAPLIFTDEVMGVLMVVEGVQGKRFDREDVQLLDLLAPQAAVAIKNSRLFEQQQELTVELESANETLETVLTGTENPVIALNRRFKVIFANPAAERLLKIAPLAGKTLLDFAQRDILPKDPRKMLRTLRKNRFYTYELTIGEKTFQCNLGLLGETRPQGYVAVLNDVSQLKQIDTLKNQILKMASHDLKNPLTAAQLQIETLKEEGEDVLTPDMKDSIVKAWNELERMQRITEGILDYEKVQAGTLTYEECDIDRIVKTVVRDLQPHAADKEVDLQLAINDSLPPIYGSRHFLMQAVNNVVDNAIKFTNAGGHVYVSATCLSDNILIRVSDTGIGVPEQDQSQIFQQFFRSPKHAAEGIKGTGLGLSLVKAVIENHQGRVWLESEMNVGTTVYMELPVLRGN